MDLIDEFSWNSFARTNAGDRFRKQSAAIGTPLTALLVREANIVPGMQVLDVACGAGEPAISIAAALQGTGQVIATDISPEPLGIAEQRGRQRSLGNIRFQVADVHSLPFKDEQFDLVTSRLGLMFFADLPKALRQMRRVLKPGGRFVTVAWGPMQQPYFETTIGTIRRLFPDLELPNSGKAMCKFGEPSVLSGALKEAGFSQANDELRELEWTWPGPPEEVWEYFQAVTIPFAYLISSIPPERKPEVDIAVVEAMAPYFRDGQVQFGGKFTLATATRQ